MDLTAKIALGIAIRVTVTLLMVSLGMETTHRAVLQLWRRPRLLAGCLVAAFVVVPVAAYAVSQLLPLSLAAKAGLWVLAITPGAPMIYRSAMRRGIGDPGLAVSFQVTVALLVIAFAPLWLSIISALTGGNYRMPPWLVLKQVGTIQLVPILVGMAMHRWLPCAVECWGKTIATVGNFALLALVAILLIALAPQVVSNTAPWTILAAVLLAAAAVAAGHFLAGPEPASRLTVATANAQRNPGLALAIVASNLPDQMPATVVVVVTYVLIALAVAAVYTYAYRAFGSRAWAARN